MIASIWRWLNRRCTKHDIPLKWDNSYLDDPSDIYGLRKGFWYCKKCMEDKE